MSHQIPTGADHGLGPEFIDESTQIAETELNPRNVSRLSELQAKGIGYWIAAAVAVVLLAEQTTLGFLLYTPILAEFGSAYGTPDVVWVITSLMLAGAVAVPILTKLGDIAGKKRALVWSVAISLVGTLICAIAPTFPILLVGRVLMAGTGVFLALSIALVRDVFPPRMRAMVIALVTNGSGIAIILGPLFSGWLVGSWGVSAPFIFQGALMLVSGILLAALVPESPLRTRAKLDILGAALLGLGIFGLMIGLIQVASQGWTLLTIGSSVVGGLLLVAWVIQIRHSSDPLINFALLKRRAILAPTLAMAASAAVAGGLNLLVVLQWSTPKAIASFGQGLTALEIGIWFIPFGIVTVISGIFVGLTVRSIGYRTHMIIAGLCYMIPPLFFVFGADVAPPALLIGAYAVSGFGMMATAAGLSLLMVASPQDQRTITMGVSNSIGGITGSIIGQVFNTVLVATSAMVAGATIFTTVGFHTAYIIAAMVGAFGLAMGILVPHGRRIPQSQRQEPAELGIGDSVSA